MASADVEFSVLVTCYYEENSIDEFYGRLSTTLEKIGRPYEIIFVNDGSRDGTWQKIKTIFSKDCRVHAALDLSKNSGQPEREPVVGASVERLDDAFGELARDIVHHHQLAIHPPEP